MKTWINRLSFKRLSIQQRLPLLICTLLLASIAIYGFANYFSLKKANLIIGRQRLKSLTGQLNTSFGQAIQLVINTSGAAAAEPSVVQYLKSGNKALQKEALGELNKLFRDTTWVSVELYDKNLVPVLRSNKSTVNISLHLKDILSLASVAPASTRIGKLYNVKGGVYYPVISAVSDKNETIGFIMAWKSVLTTPKAVAQLSQLLGIGADYYLENADGSLTTNFISVLPKAPFKIPKNPGTINFTDADGNRIVADVQLIPHTGILLGISVSEQEMLNGMTGFVKWIVLIGIVLISTGIIVTWIMSRNITKPLNQLTVVATAISKGNYSSHIPIDIYQNDELGKLANAFNIMIEQVYRNQHELEDMVEERTSQLETVNKELEAFSYSVSHDLRTPLRAINGYSIMLKEDYEAALDAEGKRIIRNIISNAKMMGQLIDDLLAFSRLGKKELVRTPIDMQQLTGTVVNELLQHEPEDKYKVAISSLPDTEADRVMIKQVLINLVGNAIKYSSKKADPVIEIGATDEPSKTVYYVKDNGAGFDMKYAGKLFGVFQRLHSQEEFEGTGVGLALVKRIIDKHKGEIRAEGMEHAGAVFYFSLPKH